MSDSNIQQVRSTKEFEYLKAEKKFIGSVSKNRIGPKVKRILLHSEKTGRFLQFDKYFTTKESYWFRNIKSQLIVEIRF